ncbi:MAG: N-methyl-L-tryptophan oxidase [Actinomycetota bacterium]|nr:N-methyl-L-tryptophan oxidase [Actinomycetota bacterium]
MTFVREADVVIVGAGVMGAATAWALAPSGRDVVVLEQFTPAHRRGSSHGRTRIFRLSYPDARWVRMAQRALKLWRELEAEVGERLLAQSGGLDIGDGVAANAAALEECGADYELEEGRAFGRRFPGIALAPGEAVLFQPDAGVVAAELSVAAFLGSAQRRGAEVAYSQRVVALHAHAEGVEVRTDHSLYRARVAVVTAGGWARNLLRTAGIELPVRVTRETVAYFALDGVPPPPVVEWDAPATYCLPSPDQGVKAAQHIAGPEVDPDSEPVPNPRSVEVVCEWVRRRLPHVDPTPHHIETCLYTNTVDERFIIERHGPIVVASPCSGHGFKFAPYTGHRIGNLAQGLET